jgi:tetratricopeptide (TPR) repeat protein
LRRIVLLLVVAAIVVSGALWGGRAWLSERDRQKTIAAMLDHADELRRTEQGLSPAAVEFKKALVLAPDDVRALRGLGEVELRLSQIPDAINHLRRAEELADPEEKATIQLSLGRALTERYRGSGNDADFRAAHNAFLEARQNPSVEPEALEAYGALFLEKGHNFNVDKALTTFDELLKKYPDHPVSTGVRALVAELRHEASKGG